MGPSAMTPSTSRVPVRKWTGAQSSAEVDALAVEEPLEIRVSWREGGAVRERPFAVTMRTPGHDRELAVGLLRTEGVVQLPEDVAGCSGADNRVCVELTHGARVDFAPAERRSYVTSACGVCGKLSIDSIHARAPFAPVPREPRLRASAVHAMP